MAHLTSAEAADLLERFRHYLREHRLPVTQQRDLIAHAIFTAPDHLTAAAVHQRLSGQGKRIGIATVYRTLKLLKECGLAFERHFGDGVSRYEVAWADEHHDHLICVECEKIIEFEDEGIEELQHKVAARKGFKLVRHKLELYGVCKDCQERS